MDGPLLPALNADEFLSWEARQFQKHELIDGFVFAYGSRSLDHSVIAVNLVGALQRAFPAPCRTFNSDVFVRAAEAVLFYPDASVVCGDVDMSARYIDAPLVVAEVLSASTRSYDLLEKRSAYRRISSLEYCVIVHTAVRRVEIDRRVCRSNWVSQSYESGELLLSVDEIYAGSSLLKRCRLMTRGRVARRVFYGKSCLQWYGHDFVGVRVCPAVIHDLLARLCHAERSAVGAQSKHALRARACCWFFDFASLRSE